MHGPTSDPSDSSFLDHQSTPSSPAQAGHASPSRHKLPSHKHQPCLEADGPKSHLLTTANQFHRLGIACPWPQLQAPLQDCRSFEARPRPPFVFRASSPLGLTLRGRLATATIALKKPSQRWSLEHEPAKTSGRRTSATKSVRGFCRTQTSCTCANPDPPPPQ